VVVVGDDSRGVTLLLKEPRQPCVAGLQRSPGTPHHLFVTREDLASSGHAGQAPDEVAVKAPHFLGESIKIGSRDRAFLEDREVVAVEAIYKYQYYVHTCSFAPSRLIPLMLHKAARKLGGHLLLYGKKQA
jgi:hypothetical protein